MEGDEFMFAYGTIIQVYGNKKIILSRCKKICEYNDIYLKADSYDMYIEIWGANLSVNDYNIEGIEIYGAIHSISFLEKKKSAEFKV